MKKFIRYLILIFITFYHSSFCRENKNTAVHNKKPPSSFGCPNTTAQTDLAVNNVRARILNGGDLWFNYNAQDGIYEIPSGSGKNSIYAGSLWVGGYDNANNLKIAAQTYRNAGANDFWSGPVAKDALGALDVSTTTCSTYDRFWILIRTHVATFAGGGASTPTILSWPGNGNVANGELPYLAPFFDVNNNGLYEPLNGDYPNYDLTGSSTTGCDQFLQGDKVIWWVFNDIGNTHTETGSGFPIGLEIRAQAFSFSSTTAAINNSTFYKYEIINRSNDALLNTYAGIWCDADLGNYADDYVGCDVGLGLGYCYNGDFDDEVGIGGGYGQNPPAVGIDIFQGPLADINDGIDNDRDGTTDEVGEQIIMSNFHYYVNMFGIPTGNPSITDDYYQYLSSTWTNGNHVTYGGNGDGTGIGATTSNCDYMFPGTTDPLHPTNWAMATAGILPDDMRFIMSAGKFTMDPGEVNHVTTGVIWARTTNGGPLGSVQLLKTADSALQQLFNNCFIPTDINEPLQSHLFSLYPNPCVSTSILKFNNNEGKSLTLSVYDSRGKLVQIQKNIVASEVVIENRLFQKGIYIFQLTDDSQLDISGKLVVL